MEKIHIVEDEPDIADLVAHNLKKERYNVAVFYDGSSFMNSLESEKPDLVILDLMLPDIDGLDICKYMRSDNQSKSIPIIILTAKSNELDIVLGLELGADDYIVKPFGVRELIARIKAVLRRSDQTPDNKQLKFNGLVADLESFEVKADGEAVNLTYAEFKILETLGSRPGKVYTRAQIIDSIWGDDRIVISKTIDVHVAHLRKKLGKYGDLIKTIRGVGYKFEP
ncbi:response regulator [Candidatus Poribacteria bacterium]|nr:response regulator [Candidatus Poribacteria bacterium]